MFTQVVKNTACACGGGRGSEGGLRGVGRGIIRAGEVTLHSTTVRRTENSLRSVTSKTFL